MRSLIFFVRVFCTLAARVPPGWTRGGAFAPLAQGILSDGGVISVQVLNEFVHVARRKLKHAWPKVEMAVQTFGEVLDPVVTLTLKTHLAALALSRDYQFSIYDGLIVASAIEAGCTELLTEDMRHGRRIGRLTIRNPFLSV